MLNSGADTQTRTGDLTLTKGALYRAELYQHYIVLSNTELERAAGIEPASSAWKAEVIAIIRRTHTCNSECYFHNFIYIHFDYQTNVNMVEGDGFEPSKAEPADLQSAPFGHSGTPPNFLLLTTSFI